MAAAAVARRLRSALPAAVVPLGTADWVLLADGTRVRTRAVLYTDDSWRRLWLLRARRGQPLSRMSPAARGRLAEVYRRFHGAGPRRAVALRLPAPRPHARRLGQAVVIGYTWIDPRSRRRREGRYHAFDHPALLLDLGPPGWAILGRFRVTARGIIG